VLLAGDGAGKAIGVYDDALRDWPRDEVRDRGLHRARLALACAQAGELDRAKAEGASAFAIAKQTRSASAARELRQLGSWTRERERETVICVGPRAPARLVAGGAVCHANAWPFAANTTSQSISPNRA
jgi:hypothetical protein